VISTVLNSMPDPATRSVTVRETSTSPGRVRVEIGMNVHRDIGLPAVMLMHCRADLWTTPFMWLPVGACYRFAMAISKVSAPQAAAIACAAWTVATTGGTTALSAADRRGISSAMATVFGETSFPDVDRLESVSSGELVRVVDEVDLRLDLVRVLAVLALLDGMVEKGRSNWSSTSPVPCMSMRSSSMRSISCSWTMPAGLVTT